MLAIERQHVGPRHAGRLEPVALACLPDQPYPSGVGRLFGSGEFWQAARSGSGRLVGSGARCCRDQPPDRDRLGADQTRPQRGRDQAVHLAKGTGRARRCGGRARPATDRPQGPSRRPDRADRRSTSPPPPPDRRGFPGIAPSQAALGALLLVGFGSAGHAKPTATKARSGNAPTVWNVKGVTPETRAAVRAAARRAGTTIGAWTNEALHRSWSGEP